MDPSHFQFVLSVPHDAQYLPMVRLLAAQAARYASCSEAEAERFGGSVEQAVQACLHKPAPTSAISIVVRREAGPVEVVVDGHIVSIEP